MLVLSLTVKAAAPRCSVKERRARTGVVRLWNDGRPRQVPRCTIHYESEVAALHGDDRLTGVTLAGPDGETELDTKGLFIMIGAAPNTGWLNDMAKLDERGFVVTGEAAGAASQYETSTPGIYAIGDVRSGSVKRVASAVGEGSVVISAACNHVAAQLDKEDRD